MSGANANDKLLGAILGDDFRVVRQLGFGGYGRVYAAEQLSVGKRMVAVKVLHAMHGDVSTAVAGLKREAAYLALMRSPCFPRILRTGTTPDGLPYFVMELIGGRTLDVAIRESGAMSLKQAAPILDALMEGVAEMHARDIVHRDIKTGNVVLEEAAGYGVRVRMLDLGSAKPAYEKDLPLSPTNPLSIGSPPYVAPETAESGQTNELTDVYGLGTIAYEMICGIRALHLKDTSPQSYTDYLCSDRSIPTYRVGTIQPDIPEAVEDVIHRALARKPRDRWPSVIQFRKAFFDAVRPVIAEDADRILLRAASTRGSGTDRPPPPARQGGLGRLIPLRFRKR